MNDKNHELFLVINYQAGRFYNLLCWSPYIDTGNADPPAHFVGAESHAQSWAAPAAGGVAANEWFNNNVWELLH